MAGRCAHDGRAGASKNAFLAHQHPRSAPSACGDAMFWAAGRRGSNLIAARLRLARRVVFSPSFFCLRAASGDVG